MSNGAATTRTAARATRLAWIPRQPGDTEKTARASGRHAARSALPVLRRAGYAILALQLVGLGTWSALLYSRFALTWDFAVYHQPWYLIAHGNLDPRTSIESLTFWRNDSEFAIWPLAPFYWIWPHDVVLLWLQDIGIVVAEAVTFGWMCELAGRRLREREAAWLAGAGLALLVLSPWIWWSASFDFHLESIGLPFAVLLARDLYRGRRRMWFWIAPVLSAGAPSAVYVVGIGLGAVLAGRVYRGRGACLAAIGMGYSALIVAIHGDNGAPLARHYGYLAIAATASFAHGRIASGTNLTTGQMVKGILGHPLRVIQALWDKRDDVSAALLPGGLLGIGFRPMLPWLLVALLSSVLSAGWRFAQPSFQLLPVYVVVPLGTVVALGWMATRWRRTAQLIAAVLIAQAVGWAVVWGPQLPVHWLRVSASSAAVLARIKAQIPQSAEVVVSQGVLGPFSDRVDVHALASSSRTSVDRGDIWFVIAPSVGTELQTTASSMALISELACPLHATLVGHAAGVWAFRWHPPRGLHVLRIPDGSAGIPGWAAAGATGQAVTSGPIAQWHATSTGRQGYVADQIEWLEPAGRYVVRVALSSAGPVNVEVWDDNGNLLLARRTVTATHRRLTVTIPVDATVAYHQAVYSGWGPFRAAFVPPEPGQRLEVRVWSLTKRTVNIYSARLTPAS